MNIIGGCNKQIGAIGAPRFHSKIAGPSYPGFRNFGMMALVTLTATATATATVTL